MAATAIALIARGRHLEYLTLGWNAVEAVVSLAAGVFAGSIALVGFGVDSVIESLSGGVLLWRLRVGEQGEARERLAHRLVGASFLVLALWVAWEAAGSLLRREAPEASCQTRHTPSREPEMARSASSAASAPTCRRWPASTRSRVPARQTRTS